MVQLALPQELHCRAFGLNFAPQRRQVYNDGFLGRLSCQATNAPKAAKNSSTTAQEPV